MSSISKLSIQGIRSFGAEDNQNQIIDFKPPLTLILGQNGSGKTTIIECLRHAITGDMPPNSGRGGSFVRDPKVAHETCVKGKIQLSFKGMNKKRYLVTKLLEATQHAKDVKFRTLESTICCRDESGANVQLNSRCADLDREVCSLLGVSKAILNNVIFCHQEDSNWPLSEGRALKQKFDDIFAATRYIKALETIRKERLNLQAKVKGYEIELKFLTEKKEQAKKLRSDLERLQVKLLSSKDRIKEIDSELQPVEKNLEVIFNAEDKVNQLKKQIAAQEAVKIEVKKNETELRRVIHMPFQGSREQLEQQIKEFQDEMQKKADLFVKLSRETISAERENNNLMAKKSKLIEELGALISEQQNHLGRISKRDTYLVNFCNELNIIVSSLLPLNENDVTSLIHQIREYIREEEEELRNTKIKYETLEYELQNRLDAAKEERAKTSHSCTLNSEQMRENMRKISSITEELSRVDALANKRMELEENIKKIENELEGKEFSEEYEDVQQKLNEARKEKHNIEALLNQLSNELSKLQREHKQRTEVDLLTKEKNCKLAEIDKIKTRYHDVILHLLGKVPEENVHHSVQKYISHISQDIQSNSDDIEKKKLKMSSLETTRQHLVNNLRRKEQELQRDKRKVFHVCGNDEFDSSFSTLEKKIKELQDEKGALIGSQYIFTTYMDKLRNVSPCCPLCHRGFKEDKEAKDLISELENKMKMVPSQLRTKQKNIEEYQEKLNKMTELRPIREGIIKLEKDILEVKEELKSCSAEIEKYQKEIYELNEMLQSNKSDHATACSIQEHAVIWDQYYAEVKCLEDKIKSATCFLGSTDMSRDIQTVCDEQDAANRQLDSVKASIEHHQKKLEEHVEYVQLLKTRKNDLRSELLQITSNLQQQNSREEQRKALSGENVDLENSIKKAKVKLSELEDKVQGLQTEKGKLHKEKDEKLDQLQMKISRIQKQLQDITYITKEINRYINDKREEKLKFHQGKLDDINNEIAAGVKQTSQLNRQRNELNKELSSHQIRERELKDNLKLLDYTNQLEEIKMTISNLQQQLDELGIASFVSQKQELLRKRDDLSSKRHQAVGEQNIREKEIQRLQEDLEGEMYKDADLKHRNKLIEIKTTTLAAQDLNKYYIALDCAIMRYHSMKMEEINKIVRELWVKTYVGNDIDYIEIRSDAQEGNLDLDKKRVYNYKVVMIKGDVAIDMRGRCSAGQKVLASLIIRLALAETFCLNCGILALDEPTTNLDRDNIESLAQALAEIVQSRSHQRNFQLIVITHDADFIELLGRSDAVEHFYKVTRDLKGLSRIIKATVQSMQ